MAWSPPALKRRHGSLQRTGDYATTRFHHLRDATLMKRGLPARRGGERWHPAEVRRVLAYAVSTDRA